MSAFKTDSFGDRIRNAADAKKAALEKFRAKAIEVDEKVLAEREAGGRLEVGRDA